MLPSRLESRSPLRAELMDRGPRGAGASRRRIKAAAGISRVCELSRLPSNQPAGTAAPGPVQAAAGLRAAGPERPPHNHRASERASRERISSVPPRSWPEVKPWDSNLRSVVSSPPPSPLFFLIFFSFFFPFSTSFSFFPFPPFSFSFPPLFIITIITFSLLSVSQAYA